jgi:hypothetical protein
VNGFLNNNLALGIVLMVGLFLLMAKCSACIDNYGNCPL